MINGLLAGTWKTAPAPAEQYTAAEAKKLFLKPQDVVGFSKAQINDVLIRDHGYTQAMIDGLLAGTWRTEPSPAQASQQRKAATPQRQWEWGTTAPRRQWGWGSTDRSQRQWGTTTSRGWL